jgi:protein-tyrosine phosphatase
MHTLDASLIVPGLYQGSAPAPGPELARLGFKGLILCADEYQLPAEAFPGLRVIHAPNDDSGREPTRLEIFRAWRAAAVVAQEVARRRAVLVTCAQGRNRSGLVSALALCLMGMKGRDAIALVRARRANALTNPAFNAYLLQR